jgi:hypothetical protein
MMALVALVALVALGVLVLVLVLVRRCGELSRIVCWRR